MECLDHLLICYFVGPIGSPLPSIPGSPQHSVSKGGERFSGIEDEDTLLLSPQSLSRNSSGIAGMTNTVDEAGSIFFDSLKTVMPAPILHQLRPANARPLVDGYIDSIYHRRDYHLQRYRILHHNRSCIPLPPEKSQSVSQNLTFRPMSSTTRLRYRFWIKRL